ncbi:MAG: sugar ABC transporter permease, partial [Planctomycetota bacterium]
MPEVIQQILNTIGGFFDSPVVQLGLRAIGLYITAIWLATAALFVPLEILHPWWMLSFLLLTAVSFCLFGFVIGVWANGW